LTFSINVTLDGCVDHQEGIADDETHAFFTRLLDEAGAMLWGRLTYEMMESYWPAVARGDEAPPPAMRDWAVKLEAKPKYVVSSTRNHFPWTHSHPITGDLRTGVQKLKDTIPAAPAADLPETRLPCQVPWVAGSNGATNARATARLAAASSRKGLEIGAASFALCTAVQNASAALAAASHTCG
jgi:hypothetical protein